MEIISNCGFSGEVSSGYPGTGKPVKNIKNLPEAERPREKLLAKGPSSLSDMELLAILLNTGIHGKNVTVLANELLKFLNKNNDIPPINDISRISGLGVTKACAVSAMLEFGRRRWGCLGTKIGHPSHIYAQIRHYADRKQERFISLSLNGAYEVLAVRVVTVGLLNRTIVHPREVFADLIQDRAAAFCVAHNHPSGQLLPSPEDDQITVRLQHSAEILGLHFLDHLIFSDKSFWSYRQNKRLNSAVEP